jgi:uncharacterized RDD family membrane protein YckC
MVGKSIHLAIDCKTMSNHTNKVSIKATSKNYAGVYPRILAHNIDLVILLPMFYAIGYFVPGNGSLLLYCSLLYFFYYILFESISWRGTIGKKLLKIKIDTDTNKGHIKFKQVILRNLLKILSAGLLLFGFVLIAFDKKKRGLHDRIAGTVVIFIEN